MNSSGNQMKRWLTMLCLLSGCSAPKPSGPLVSPSWSIALAGVETPVVRDGRLYVRGYHAGSREPVQLFGLDSASGKELWSAPLSTGEGPLRASSDGRVLADGKIFDGATGKTVSNTTGLVDEKNERVAALKRPDLNQSGVSDTCWDGLYYCFDKDGLLAYDLKRKKAAWKLALAPTPIERRVQAEPIGILVTAGNLSLLEARSGKQLWSYTLPGQVSYGSLLTCNGSVVLAQANEFANTSINPTLVAIKQGKELWRFAPVEEVLSADERQIIVTGLTPDGVDYHAGLEAGTGKELWRASGYAHGPVLKERIYQAHHDQHADMSSQWTGDKRGNKLQGGIQLPDPVSTAYLEARQQGVQVWHGPVYSNSEMYGPVLAGDWLYVCTLSQMQGGTSSVQAYKLPPP